MKDLSGAGVQIEFGCHSDNYLNWCDEVIISPGVSLNTPFILKAVQLNKRVVSEIELAYQFIEKPIIAITGTNGKTTTTSLIGEILSRSGYKVFVGGNIGTPIISVADYCSDYDFIILEASSFQLQAIDRFRPYISIFLNLSPNHLDHHKDFNEYFMAKMNIFKNQTENDWAIISTDNELIKDNLSDIKAKKIFLETRAENYSSLVTILSHSEMINLT